MFKFNAHLVIDGTGVEKSQARSPADYEQKVATLYYRIALSHTGAAVLSAIGAGHQRLLVRPYTTADTHLKTSSGGEMGVNNAFARQLNTQADSHSAGHNSEIHYSPSTWHKYVLAHQKGHEVAGAHMDEVLLHETVHALRQLYGVNNHTKLDHAYDSEEEFFAILVANIYASELGRLHDLRADHHGHQEMSHSQDSSARFLPAIDPLDYKWVLVKKLVHEEPVLAKQLAHVKAPFNPIRRYFQLIEQSHHAAKGASHVVKVTHAHGTGYKPPAHHGHGHHHGHQHHPGHHHGHHHGHQHHGHHHVTVTRVTLLNGMPARR